MAAGDLWDEEWRRRTDKSGVVFRNVDKARIICKKLWDRPYLIPMNKIEVGCGPAFHVSSLAQYCREWGERYLGIDMSEHAVGLVRRHGLDARVGDFLDMDFGNDKYNLFLFLDVLEHIRDWDGLVNKIRSVAAGDIVIIGNVPMAPFFKQRNEEIADRPITLAEIASFVASCGCTSIDHEVYGVFGYPYLFFEATNWEEGKGE